MISKCRRCGRDWNLLAPNERPVRAANSLVARRLIEDRDDITDIGGVERAEVETIDVFDDIILYKI